MARLSRLIVCEGPALRPALSQIDQVAQTPATVLLLGETGVGKDVFAQALHELSPRGHRQMIRVSCAAIPSALIESELFGRERGAFTGALTRQIGRFEAAHQSTLFLDEIGDLPAEVQVKLLRVLQERVIERLGSVQPIKVDVRIIAATNRNLEQAVRDKTFREDLFYRLNVFPIVVPPLRERVEDIPALAWEFVDEFSKTLRQADRVHLEGVDAAVPAIPMAWQRARAAERDRARDDSGHGAMPDRAAARIGSGARSRPRARRSGAWRSTTSARPSRARIGGSAVMGAPPNVSG